MNKKKYFIAEDGEQKGPFSINELKEMSISKTTLIWKEGYNDWKEARKIEKLQILLKVNPPKLPDNIQKKTNSEKTFNVNLGLGKPKSKIELKEKELEQEKLKANFANTIIYLLKNSFLVVIILAVFFYTRSQYVDSSDYSNHPDPVVADNYNLFTSVFNYIGSVVLIYCFYLIFHRPIIQIYNWFNKYSKKEI